MWVKFSCCRRRRSECKTPWLGKDVILVILHEAATDYETFCNVRLVAKWVARTMDISPASLQSSPKHENWRLMVEDAALRRVEQSVKKARELCLLDLAEVDGSYPLHDADADCEVIFERRAQGLWYWVNYYMRGSIFLCVFFWRHKFAFHFAQKWAIYNYSSKPRKGGTNLKRMWVRFFSSCRRRQDKTPWLGKDVILVILHQAATDYETFCNVRLTAKWVAQTMDILAASAQASHPSQVKWRHMVEDAALARVSAHVKTAKDVVIFQTRETRNFPILPWYEFEVNARIKFIRQDNDSLEIVRKEWMYSDELFARCRDKRSFNGRSCARYLRLASKIRFVDGCYYISVERQYDLVK